MFAHNTILSAIVSVALLSTSATALAVPEPAGDLQSRATAGISVEQACNRYYGGGAHAEATGGGCYDWVCVSGNQRLGLDLAQFCRDSYGSGASASCSNGVYSWLCNF